MKRRQAERFKEIGTGAPNQLFRVPGISGHEHDGGCSAGRLRERPASSVRLEARNEQHEIDSIDEQMIDRVLDFGRANDLVGVAEHVCDNLSRAVPVLLPLECARA